MRWLLVSVCVHALLLWLLRPHRRIAPPLPPVPTEEPPTEVVLVDPPPPPPVALAGAHGGGGAGGGHARHAGVPVHAGGWDRVTVGMEARDGHGNGIGNGNGNGNGIGFGDGGGIATRTATPAPPAPPPPSKARPAKLLQPTRDRAVEDDDDLFVARVTVDEGGDVVAVRFVTTHPGLRGDQASSAIWSFRYAPALDDEGLPIRSTFEQPFQVR